MKWLKWMIAACVAIIGFHLLSAFILVYRYGPTNNQHAEKAVQFLFMLVILLIIYIISWSIKAIIRR